MASFRAIMNPFTGKMTLIRADSAFHLKDSVDTHDDLPVTGNTENDVRITEDTDKMYTWGIASSSGTLSDWKEIGSATSIDWSNIDNKPSSSVVNIDDAVSKKHSHSNKTELDKVTDGDHDVRTDNPHGVTKSDVGLSNVPNSDTTDAISKAHTQGTDQKLDEDGDNEVSASTITGHISNTENPHSVDKTDVGLGNVDNKSEATIITDVKADSDVSDAISKKHASGSDNQDLSGLVEKVAGSSLVADTEISKIHSQNTDKDITLDSAPSSDTTATGIKTTFTAGESLVFGEIGYMKSDGKIWKADADSIDTSFVIVMALASISADASGSFLILGIVRNDAWAWTVGGEIYLSTDAGALTQSAPSGTGDAIIVVGIATHADRMLFRPDLTIIEHT